jgi:L-serine dehydratase
MNILPSIFNDVIGPVMRGPSSSHTAASWRIARTCLDILKEPLKKAIIDFDTNSIWSLNYREQGTVMGINGGLLGFEITDSLMADTEKMAEKMGILISYEINSFPTKHTNTVRLLLEGISGRNIQVVAVSLGGGSFEIQQIDGFDVSISGDYFELLVQSKSNDGLLDELKKILPKNTLLSQSSGKKANLVNLKSSNKITNDIINLFNNDRIFSKVIIVNPILPIVF